MNISEFKISETMKEELVRQANAMITANIEKLQLAKPFDSFFVSANKTEGARLIQVFEGRELGLSIEKIFLFHA